MSNESNLTAAEEAEMMELIEEFEQIEAEIEGSPEEIDQSAIDARALQILEDELEDGDTWHPGYLRMARRQAESELRGR